MSNSRLAVYQRGDRFLLLNPQLPAWIVTNLTGAIAVQAFEEEKSIEKVIEILSTIDSSICSQPVIDFLNSDLVKNLFMERNTKLEYMAKPLRHIYLNMTSACNLRCVYCFAATRVEHGSKGLNYDDYIRLIDDLVAMSFVGKITFTGGEPLLSDNTIKVALYAKTKGLKTGLLTNGTLIGADNVEQICNVIDEFQISMDGSTAVLHDHYRGQGSYDKTIKAIELIEKRHAKYRIAMTVTRENSKDIASMSKLWGQHLLFQPLFPLGRAEKNSSALSGIEYYNALRDCAGVNPFSHLNNMISENGHYRCDKCAIGDSELSISCTGDVYPCQLLHNDNFLLGNISNKSIIEIYNSNEAAYYKKHTVDQIKGCETCDFRYLCGGACQARHFSETGCIDIAGSFCSYEKEGIIRGLIDSCDMVETNIHQ